MNAKTPIRFRRGLPRLLPLILAVAVAQTGCGDAAQDAQEQGLELLQIAERGDVSALDALLKRDTDANYRDSCHWTPLMKAALNGHTDAVQRLLAAGADIDAKDKGGYTAPMLAASNNHADIVALLLDRGAMIDAQELTQGFTALTWAAQRGHRETVELLLARGADTTLPDFEGKTAAERAAEQGHAALQALLSNGSSPTAQVAPAG
ncbi:MAG: ankyrin repeat domain-containing protein [Thiohalocapsa sp.]